VGGNRLKLTTGENRRFRVCGGIFHDTDIQVGALARCYFPDGILVAELDKASALARTNELLKQERVTIFEAAIQHGACFCRVDILVKDGACIDLIEVKAKSYDQATSEGFLQKRAKEVDKDWLPYVYRAYFKGLGTVPAVETRDVDFLVPPSAVFEGKTDVPELLKDLGFITGFRGEQGAMLLEHPELLIEFLVPERGRGSEKLRDLPALGMNAQLS
jgi:hypothetical protein